MSLPPAAPPARHPYQSGATVWLVIKLSPGASLGRLSSLATTYCGYCRHVGHVLIQRLASPTNENIKICVTHTQPYLKAKILSEGKHKEPMRGGRWSSMEHDGDTTLSKPIIPPARLIFTTSHVHPRREHTEAKSLAQMPYDYDSCHVFFPPDLQLSASTPRSMATPTSARGFPALPRPFSSCYVYPSP